MRPLCGSLAPTTDRSAGMPVATPEGDRHDMTFPAKDERVLRIVRKQG